MGHNGAGRDHRVVVVGRPARRGGYRSNVFRLRCRMSPPRYNRHDNHNPTRRGKTAWIMAFIDRREVMTRSENQRPAFCFIPGMTIDSDFASSLTAAQFTSAARNAVLRAVSMVRAGAAANLDDPATRRRDAASDYPDADDPADERPSPRAHFVYAVIRINGLRAAKRLAQAADSHRAALINRHA